VAGSGGCVEDGAGSLWLASSPVVRVDVATLSVQQTVALPEYVHGVSIDFAGRVWAVALGTNAYRIDPATGTYDTFSGLVDSYTYSDMTGFALASVAP
jgi:streptogramin lyase